MIRTIVGLLNSYYTDRDNKTKGALTMGYAVEVIKANGSYQIVLEEGQTVCVLLLMPE